MVDPIYNSKLVTRLINKLMLDGKKNVAQDILYNAFDIVEAKTGRQPMEVFEQALSNICLLYTSEIFYVLIIGIKGVAAEFRFLTKVAHGNLVRCFALAQDGVGF